jgi:3-oxoacyl-(acyl-carrier-protein) synthase
MSSSSEGPGGGGIVVTGLGAVCPLGLDAPSFWRRLAAGESGIADIEKIDTSGLRNARGGEVRGFDWSPYGDEGDCDEATAFAYAAAHEALADAALGIGDLNGCGLILGTNFGGAASWEGAADMMRDTEEDEAGGTQVLAPGAAQVLARAPGRVDRELFEQFSPEGALDFLCEGLHLGGPRLALSNACSSGTHAIGLALDWLRLGRCERVLCGGYDGLGISTMAGLSILRTISPDECRPFDLKRSGTLFGEGAGVLLLETWEAAQRRDAKTYALALGYAVNNNAHHLTAPDKGGRGLEMAMRGALRDAKIGADEIDYINAHGTGTQYNDVAETQAIKQVLGERAHAVPVSSIKGATSHTMGAAGALEAIACVLAMQHQTLPPTLNYTTPDPACDLDYVPNVARAARVQTVLSNSSGIGGNNASLVLRVI